MMSDLPADLVEEILCRVPATSLRRLRSTCKRWNALFKNRGFTERHSRKAAKESLVLMVKEGRFCPMSINLNVATPSIEVKSALSLKDSNSEQVRIARVFHCNGLLLCTTMDNRLVVWNPCLRETKWIQPKTDYMCYSDFALGYQTNKSCRSYKILRCWDCGEKDFIIAFEIYEFSSDSWRVLDNVVLDCFIQQEKIGLSLKGNSYWLADDGSINILLSFDFTTEDSKLLYIPPDLNYSSVRLSVVREEELVLLHPNFHTSKMEIWMTNNFDSEAALLWRKSFTVDLNIHTAVDYIPECRSFLIVEGKKKAVCCTISSKYLTTWQKSLMKKMVYMIGVEDDQYYREISYEESTMLQHPIIFSYVPSLVQI